MADGDIRRALNALELAALTTPPEKDGSIHITLNVAEESIRRLIAASSEDIGLANPQAMNAIDEVKSAEVPLHLRDTHYSGAVKLGHEGYQYPHNYPGHYVKQEYLPKQISRRIFL